MENSNPYQQAFESLSKYTYDLSYCAQKRHHIVIWDKGVNAIIFDDWSSDFFTLMQMFYSWERSQ